MTDSNLWGMAPRDAAGNTADKTAWELEISSINDELLHHDIYRKSFACLER